MIYYFIIIIIIIIIHILRFSQSCPKRVQQEESYNKMKMKTYRIQKIWITKRKCLKSLLLHNLVIVTLL